MLLQTLFYTFCVVVFIQFFYYGILYVKFAFLPDVKTSAEEQFNVRRPIPISVIIAARNESKNLKQYLSKVLNQDYADYEIIIINDASTDKTIQIIESFQKEYKHLKFINLEATKTYSGNKKNAITKGIEVASNDYLLFTDADCYPTSENWITEITSHFNAKKEIVLGYGAYQKSSTFLNKLIRYETLLTAIQYFSYAKARIPYMGVGRNTAYKKGLFLNSNGFKKHQHIKSGDDDLFINEIATNQNTSICFSKNSFTLSEPKKTFKSWFKQKRRHISTANNYKPIHQFLLGLFYFSQLIFWLLAIILVAFSFNWQLVTILVAIRLISQYIVIYNSANKLNEKDLITISPILDVALVFTQFGLFISNLIFKPKNW